MNNTTLFGSYEQDYATKSAAIGRRIRELATASSVDVHRAKAAEVDALIKEADKLVKCMELEARSIPSDRAAAMMQRVRACKVDLSSLKQQSEQAAGAAAARSELGLAGASSSAAAAQQQRDRLLSSTQRLQETSQRLQTGRQQLAEAEATGESILSELQRQRETIQHAQHTLDGSGAELKQAEGTLKRMYNRAKWLFG